MKTKKLVLGLVLVCVATMFVACDSGNNPPVYNDQGECVENCPLDVIGGDNLPDAFNEDNGLPDAINDDGLLDCGGGDQHGCQKDIPDTPDQGQYECPNPQNPPAECKPVEAQTAYCSGPDAANAICSQGSFDAGKKCTSDEECQKVDISLYPACVCWDLCWMNMKNYEGTWMCNPMDPPDERRWREFGKFGELKDAGAKCVLELNSKFNSGYDYGYYTPGIPNTLYASFREKDLIFNEDHTLFQIKDKEGTTLEWCSFLQTN